MATRSRIAQPARHRAAGRPAIRESEGAFVIDLCDVEFLDSSGLSALLRARALLARDDRQLAVVCPPGPVRRLFDLAGVDELVVVLATREEALSALVPPG